MKSHKFKIGDRVRVIASTRRQNVGRIGTVVDYYDNDQLVVQCATGWHDELSTLREFPHYKLELVIKALEDTA